MLRYIQKAKIDKEGVLVVGHSEPFLPPKDLIIVPQAILKGLLTSLHISLKHPTVNQLTKVFNRDYFALRSIPAIKLVWENCSTCQSLRKIPNEVHTQSSTDFPLHPTSSIAADVIRRYKQKILLLRDTFSSYTLTKIIPNEDHVTLKSNLIVMISSIRSNPQSHVIVRVDNAPGFRSLKDDSDLSKLGIIIDLGRVKNKNKNPVAEKAINEFISELLRYCPEGGAVNDADLAVVTNTLNSRIRNRGLTAWEILFQRDTDTAKQLDFIDKDLAIKQTDIRLDNQVSSAKSKAKGGKTSAPASVGIGSLVFIKDEGDKTMARDRYIITKLDGNMCTVMKLNKSKFQKKEYEVKLTEVFPVTPTIHISDNCERGLESSDEDMDWVDGNDSSNNVSGNLPVDSNLNSAPVELLDAGEHEHFVPDADSDNVNDADNHVVVEQVDSLNCPPEAKVDVVSDAHTSCRPKRTSKKPSYF